MIKLRPYQSKLIDDVRMKMRQGHKNVLIQLPTGGGKTAIASEMISTAVSKGLEQWFVCNRQELIDQTARSLYNCGIPFSYIANGYEYDPKKKVHVCSIQTLHRRLDRVKKPDIIYWDECRMIASPTCSGVYWNNPKCFHIGLDATPCRLSGEPLGDYFSAMVHGPSVRELISMGYLCDYKIFAPKVASFDGVGKRAGDYISSEIDDIMNQKKILGNAVREYQLRAAGKRNLVFCNSVAHSRNLRAEFSAAGIASADIDGSMNDLERRKTLEKFAKGEILVLTSVNLVTAGYDLPAIECVTLERPTMSVAMAKQMIGRGLRPHEDKEKLIILDHVNMWQTHGLPDDEYEWTLSGRKKPAKKTETQVKQCEKCYYVYPASLSKCPECSYEKPVAAREVDMAGTNDELVEIDPNQIRINRLKEQGQAQSKEDLEKLGLRRGMKPHNARRWADHVFKARQAKRLRGM